MDYGSMTFIIHLLSLVSTVPVVVNSHTNAEIHAIYTKSVEHIVRTLSKPQKAEIWQNGMNASGMWKDVDYTAGCEARTASWPARQHFERILVMSAKWNQNQGDSELVQKIRLGLNHWFERDFKHEDCIYAAGSKGYGCRCGSPGYWSSNWYNQMIGMPTLVGATCLLLKPVLTPEHFKHCTNQLGRSFVRINGDPNGKGGRMTGANRLDVAAIGVSLALLTEDLNLMGNATSIYYNECQIRTGRRAEGPKVDGAFFQHSTQIYNGHYGANFVNQMIKLLVLVAGTSFSPPESIQETLLTLVRGGEWMMYLKTDSNHSMWQWQYSVIGRMISFKYENWLEVSFSWNFDDILKATEDWPSHEHFQNIIRRLTAHSRLSAVSGVNPGSLVGTRFFHTADYMVHRGENFITTLKMFSERTTNSECCNKQNPKGFHLSDGAIYTYITGNEYTDVLGAWDWNLIPGTTVDYDGTKLSCSTVQKRGKGKFVGGVAFGSAGVAVMDYTNPITSALHWKKAFFFFPGGYVVQFMGDVLSKNQKPIVTTLDQRQRAGEVRIDGEILQEGKITKSATTVWHDRVGYRFLASPVPLTIDLTPKRSDWKAIGVSTGNETTNLVSLYFTHPPGVPTSPFAYKAELDVSLEDFLYGSNHKRGGVQLLPIKNKKINLDSNATTHVLGVSYRGEINGGGLGERIIGLAFWTAGALDTGLEDISRIETDSPILLLFQKANNNSSLWTLGLADPTQALKSVNIVVTFNLGTGSKTEALNINLPRGAWAGSTVTHQFSKS